MELLRLATAGSVDDGKSTLIGRLLLDTDSIYDDQIAAVEKVSQRRGDEQVNLALLTDGLKAEREQGITIDVAYRYFSTARRKFILADCPGHIQYTRNMITGASNANVVLLMVDARNGLVEQTRRHSFVASLLRIPHLVMCVNKMDLVDYSQKIFDQLRRDFENFSKKLEISDITFIPISALNGDNVVESSTKMPWYKGRCVLNHLEEIHIASDENYIDFRMPIQMVIRPQSTQKELHDYRGYAGRVISGQIKVGDEVVALPGETKSKVIKIEEGGKEVMSADPLSSVILHLQDNLDVSRGDMLVRPLNWPKRSNEIEAVLCWMNANSLTVGKKYILRHTTRELQCLVSEIQYQFDIEHLNRNFENKEMGLNAIGRVKLKTSQELWFDPYRQNRGTGSFILVEPQTFETVGGGVILGTGNETNFFAN